MRKAVSLCYVLLPLMAMGEVISSPDGKLDVDVYVNDGKPVYEATLNGVQFLAPSPLGLVTDFGDFTCNMTLDSITPEMMVKDRYSLPNIKKSDVTYSANRRGFIFSQNGVPVYEVVFEVSDNNIAFKYLLKPVKETLCAVVKEEATGFVMPEGTTTFLCPQSGPMGGFARTSPSYETSYTVDEPTGKNGWGEGYTFPCLFRNSDKGWILVSETGVDRNYCASRLLNGGGDLYTIGYPQPGEMNGLGSVSPGISLPGETPWRTVTVGETLAPIVETTVPFDVVRPQYNASRDYQYGKGTWSWIIKMDPSCNFDEQKRYIDFSANLGYSTVLVDALWDTQIGYNKIEELARYGKEKGVDLYLWYNSNGYWNDAPQGPRGIMDNPMKRRKEMAWMQENGIRGIKVDFFGGDKQQMMQLYQDILTDANDYGILVIFHGCTLPRGWERMFPNYAASEAVLASENLHFSQGSCDAEAFNATLHPFIRNTVGSMDFGGSALNKYYSADNSPHGSRRVTSDVFALATAVLFQSPVQHFALAPNNLTDAPDWAIDFMKVVPTTWDETRYIDGYPGRYVVLARRHGDKWYIAGVNAQKEPLKLKLPITMLKKGTNVKVYSDSSELEGSVTDKTVNEKQLMDVVIPCNGGILIVEE